MKILNIISSYFQNPVEFFPFLRTLLLTNDQSNFIDSFLNSKLLSLSRSFQKKDMYLDYFCPFFRYMSIIDSIKPFQNSIYNQILIDFIINPKYSNLILPVLKIKESNSSSFQSICKQTTLILLKARSDHTLLDISCNIFSLLKDSVKFLDKNLVDDFINQLLNSSSQLPEISNSIQIMNSFLDLLIEFCIQFPEHINKVAFENTLIMNNLNKFIPNCKGDDTTISYLISLSLLHRVDIYFSSELPIINTFALKTAYQLSINSNLEKQMLLLIRSLCNNSISNTYECFYFDFVGILLTRIDQIELIEQIILLYRLICTNFFSSLTLQQTFDTIYNKNLNNSIGQQLLIETLSSLIGERVPSSVDCFFHFNGVSTGIFGPSLDSSLLNPGWSFSTSFRSESDEFPLFSLIESNSSFLNITIIKQKLIIERNNFKFTFDFRFRLNQWYHLILCFCEKEIILYIDNKLISSEKVYLFEFSNRSILKICNNKGKTFIGDLGPTYIFSTNEFNLISNISNTGRPKYSICSFDPTTAKGQILNDVSKNESASIVGSAVPFTASLIDIIQQPGIFKKVLPIFEFLNTETPESEQIFHSLITILRLLISLSLDMEIQFEQVGGFKLLSGFLTLVHSSRVYFKKISYLKLFI